MVTDCSATSLGTSTGVSGASEGASFTVDIALRPGLDNDKVTPLALPKACKSQRLSDPSQCNPIRQSQVQHQLFWHPLESESGETPRAEFYRIAGASGQAYFQIK